MVFLCVYAANRQTMREQDKGVRPMQNSACICWEPVTESQQQGGATQENTCCVEVFTESKKVERKQWWSQNLSATFRSEARRVLEAGKRASVLQSPNRKKPTEGALCFYRRNRKESENIASTLIYFIGINN